MSEEPGWPAGLHRARHPHHLLRLTELWPGLRGVGEGEPGGVDDPVVADQRHGHLGRLPTPLPALSELGDVGDDTEHALLTPVHCLRLHISEPNLQVGSEAFSSQLQHSHVSTSVEVEGVDERNRSDRASDWSHPLVVGVLHLVGGDDGPAGPVIQHLFVGLLGAGRGLELNLIILSFLMMDKLNFIARIQLNYKELNHYSGLTGDS